MVGPRVVGFAFALLVLLASPATAQGSLTVNPAVSVSVVSWAEEVSPGLPSVLAVQVSNRAASPDSFRLTASVEANGWLAAPHAARTPTLAPEGAVPFPDPTRPGEPMPASFVVNVTVTPPPFALAGERVPIAVTAWSTNSTSAHATATANATVLAVHRVALACLPTRLSVEAGGPAAPFRVRVQNLGNGPDAVDLRAVAPGLAVAFAVSPALLGATATMDVEGNVTAPADASGSRALDVRGQSRNDATAGDVCTLDVTVVPAAAERAESPAPAALGFLAVALAALVGARRRR